MATQFTFESKNYLLEDGETVLDCLLRHGEQIPSSCKAGACQSCLMQATDGDPGSKSQVGLKETMKQQNFFLSCQSIPDEDLKISLPSMADTTVTAQVIEKESLCHNVVSLKLKPLQKFSCRAGQYINLIKDDGKLIRSYSVANLPEKDGYLELHIRRIENGAMSVWACDEAQTGDEIQVRGPAGDCFYIAPDNANDFPILLAGTGTGLAPLMGVIRDAISKGHKGEIQLLHGALKANDLYYVDELISLAAEHSNFNYTPCVLKMDEQKAGFYIGPLDEVVTKRLDELDKKSLYSYFCGGPDMVNRLKKKTFLAGAASKNIFSDPFIMQSK